MSSSAVSYLYMPVAEDDWKYYMSGGLIPQTGSLNGISTGGVPSMNNSSVPERTSKTNLYIKGLPTDFNDRRLEALVPDQQMVKSVKAASDDGSTCKGYGFIDFLSEEAAVAAQKFIQEHHSAYTVKFAKENEKDTTNLYITNLPPSWKGKKDEERLKEEFEKFGSIQSVHIQTDPSTNRSTGVGFVRFTTEDGAKKALESLREQPKFMEGSTLPLQAKYADKHNPAARARRSSQLPSGGKMRMSPRDYLFPSTATLPTALTQYHNLLMRPGYPYSYSNLNGSLANSGSALSSSGLHPFAIGSGMSPVGGGGGGAAASANNLFANNSGAGTAANLGHTLISQLPTVNSAMAHTNQLTFISNDLMAQGALQYIPFDYSQLLNYYPASMADHHQ